jgi:L,D-peptidoglycan transpeptidase YkuD (ErfK/YbiS/YcfS/YnhG family)
MHILITKNYLIYRNFKVKCALGKRGIGNKKIEGDLITPKGIYKIKYLLYRRDRVKKVKTKLKKIIIKKNMGWCNDPRSNNYNKLINIPNKYTYENLLKRNNIYDLILVLNYNMSPTKKNKGSAIFIHIAKKNYENTEGCIAIKKIELKKLLADLTNNTKVKII